MRTPPGTHTSADTQPGHSRSPCRRAHGLCVTPRAHAQPHGWTRPHGVPSWMYTRAKLPSPSPSRACAHRLRRRFLCKRPSRPRKFRHSMSGAPTPYPPWPLCPRLPGMGCLWGPHRSRRRHPPPQSDFGELPDSFSCAPAGQVGHCLPCSPVDLCTVPEDPEEPEPPPSDCHEPWADPPASRHPSPGAQALGPTWSEPGVSPLLGRPRPPLSPAVCSPALGLDKSWELESLSCSGVFGEGLPTCTGNTRVVGGTLRQVCTLVSASPQHCLLSPQPRRPSRPCSVLGPISWDPAAEVPQPQPLRQGPGPPIAVPWALREWQVPAELGAGSDLGNIPVWLLSSTLLCSLACGGQEGWLRASPRSWGPAGAPPAQEPRCTKTTPRTGPHTRLSPLPSPYPAHAQAHV